ncbi:MAG: hypothetical protein ACXWV4_12895 [Flavitalea sp.]
MKKLVTIILVGCCVHLSAQQPATTVPSGQQPSSATATQNPSVNQRLDSIENQIREGNYVRIPQKDFDEILDAKVSTATQDEVQDWVWIIVTFFGALMTLLTFWLNRKLKDEVAESITLKSKNIEQSIETVSTTQTDTLKKVKVLDEKIANTMDMFWDEMAMLILEKGRDKKNLDGEFEKKINHFLKYEHVTLSDARQIQLIDTLMRSYYYSNEEDNKYKKMVKLIGEYENKFELEPQTYANAAIAHSNIYELYGHESDRVNSLINCEKSILRKKDYGIPYTVKLEIYMIDYVKAPDEIKKKEALDNIRTTFKSIENNQSTIISVEVIERMNIDRTIDYLKPYYTQLELMFDYEVNKIRQRALEYYLKNYTITVTNEKDLKNLEMILKHGLEKRPVNIDGRWKVTGITNSGLVEMPGAIDEIISIKGYMYESNGELGSGMIYFLNGGSQLTMFFYKNNQNNTFIKVPSIYRIDQGIMNICYDRYLTGTPTGFVTNAENKYIDLQLELVPVMVANPTAELAKKLN